MHISFRLKQIDVHIYISNHLLLFLEDYRLPEEWVGRFIIINNCLIVNSQLRHTSLRIMITSLFLFN